MFNRFICITKMKSNLDHYHLKISVKICFKINCIHKCIYKNCEVFKKYLKKIFPAILKVFVLYSYSKKFICIVFVFEKVFQSNIQYCICIRKNNSGDYSYCICIRKKYSDPTLCPTTKPSQPGNMNDWI